jgi:hypothetical protein
MTATVTKPIARFEKGLFLTEAVKLAGFQAALKPSKYGYSLSATVPNEIEDLLEEDRENCLKWAQSKLTNPKRSVCKPAPWIEDEENPGNLRLKFSWSDDDTKPKPVFVDSDSNPITDINLPLYSDAIVKLIFKQRAYILKDGVTYGTSLKLVGCQIISVNNKAGFDSGDLSEEDVASMFSSTAGYKENQPNVVPTPEVEDEDLDF